MHFLIALLAFATVMILLSTLVMMIVNGINGLVRLRSRTLERSMRLLYEDVVAPRLGEEPTKASSKAFARDLLTNPALRTPGSVLERTWFGPKDFDRLSSRRFVEQLARTSVGRQLAKQHSANLTEQLEGVVYQFERYSDAANTYFLRRSKVISIVAAIVVAFSLNIDSVRLFSGFLQNRELANSFATLGNTLQEDVAQGDNLTNEYKSVLVEQLASAQMSGLSIGPTQFPFCQTLFDIRGVTNLADVDADVMNLGRDPRCRDDKYVSIAHTGLVAPLFSRGRTDIIGRFTGDRDARMKRANDARPNPSPDATTAATSESFQQAADLEPALVTTPGEIQATEAAATDDTNSESIETQTAMSDPEPLPVVDNAAALSQPEPIVSASPSAITVETETVFERDVIVMLLWLLSVFVSAGMIGLGAPFWAKAYAQIAALVPAMKVIAPLVSDRSKVLRGRGADAGGSVYRDRSRDRVQRDEDESLRTRDSMRQAFDHSLPPTSSATNPPTGMRLGDSSARSIVALGAPQSNVQSAGRVENSSDSGSGEPETTSTARRPRRRLPTV